MASPVSLALQVSQASQVLIPALRELREFQGQVAQVVNLAQQEFQVSQARLDSAGSQDVVERVEFLARRVFLERLDYRVRPENQGRVALLLLQQDLQVHLARQIRSLSRWQMD